jgi:hypothetical protein
LRTRLGEEEMGGSGEVRQAKSTACTRASRGGVGCEPPSRTDQRRSRGGRGYGTRNSGHGVWQSRGGGRDGGGEGRAHEGRVGEGRSWRGGASFDVGCSVAVAECVAGAGAGPRAAGRRERSHGIACAHSRARF